MIIIFDQLDRDMNRRGIQPGNPLSTDMIQMAHCVIEIDGDSYRMLKDRAYGDHKHYPIEHLIEDIRAQLAAKQGIFKEWEDDWKKEPVDKQD